LIQHGRSLRSCSGGSSSIIILLPRRVSRRTPKASTDSTAPSARRQHQEALYREDSRATAVHASKFISTPRQSTIPSIATSKRSIIINFSRFNISQLQRFHPININLFD